MHVESFYLQKLKEEQILMNLYSDRFSGSDMGFILDYNEEFLLMEKFDSSCRPSGIVIFRRENISRIRWGGNEMLSASILLDESSRAKQPIRVNMESMETILQSINDLYGHVTVHTESVNPETCYIGEIESLDSQTIVIHEFGTMTTLDRKYILLPLEDITRVEAAGAYEMNLQKLFVKRTR